MAFGSNTTILLQDHRLRHGSQCQHNTKSLGGITGYSGRLTTLEPPVLSFLSWPHLQILFLFHLLATYILIIVTHGASWFLGLSREYYALPELGCTWQGSSKT